MAPTGGAEVSSRVSDTLADVKPYASAIVTYRMLLDGYKGAVARVGMAARSTEFRDVYAPMFEALNWEVALDDRVRAHWAPNGKVMSWNWRNHAPDGELAASVRFARNRVHHQWSEAIVWVTAGAEGEWAWRDLKDLPSGPSFGLGDYERISGTPVRHTLERLVLVYSWIGLRLEPGRWICSPDPGK